MKTTHNLIPEIKQTQTLSTRQLQNLKILEFSNYELQQHIQNELESNPLLEQDYSFEDGYISKCQCNFELMLNYVVQEESLQDILQQQIHCYRKPIHEDLAIFLSNLLDENGYLTYSNKKIQKYFSQYSIDDIEDTINILQTFEPSGIFARNLQECLLIQLTSTSHKQSNLAITLVNDFLEDIALNNLNKISSHLKVSVDDIKEAVSLIKSLNPKPGSNFASSSIYLYPDIFVSVDNDEVHIELFRNNYGLHLQSYDFLSHYEDTKKYLKQEKVKAEHLISSINKRNTTLLHITESIIAHQLAYFTEGKALRPLSLKIIADELQYSESTISRCISNKSLIFNTQIIPLKYFFVKSVSESDKSTNEVYKALKDLIHSENPNHPYSDQKLCYLLNENGFQISRRTVAKYRNILHVPSAAQRKQ